MEFRDLLTAIKASIIASSCCGLPLALAFLFMSTGVGNIILALQVAKYKDYFLLLGTMFLFASLYLLIKKKSGGTCNVCDVRKSWKIILINILTYVILTTAIVYGVLPILAEELFR
ncbi:MAG: hypothetical protein L6243_06940 [Candidatus Altiarchaeales archaeon]|nr:hypothetical protein [Candidatus Altiarchaeota archaeon]MBU4341579.1 hypothetical protein [Candidatus Altiarchaeota archaeon]MBU4406132.1 hypothetical protein [Candidatus Altiarchaeota archaeon]MBU4437568.1 hypothetical protein [Candidatus Altiarchaeota archaeon]MCG2783307.1 hypothetical protein [Candidatus Altiarchaeales archaeon]